MISYIEGNIIQKTDKFVVVETSGLGYKIYASGETLNKLPQVGAKTKLYCVLEIKEDAHDLYGFLNREERDFYEMLRRVSGVGPKSALAILSMASAKMIASSIASGNVAFLAKVSGIGRKTAEKIILELRDKIEKLEPAALATEQDVEVLEALQVLGYTTREASQVLQSLPKGLKGTETKLKEALKFLGQK